MSSLYIPSGPPALDAPRSYEGKPITGISYQGNTTITGTPAPDSPATLTPVEPPAVPGAAKQIGPLYSLPDGTRDIYDGETGVLVRRVGKLVLDGTANLIYASGRPGNGNTILFAIDRAYTPAQLQLICSHFECKSVFINDVEGVMAIGTGPYQISFAILKSRLIAHGLEDGTTSTYVPAAKAWLAAQAAAGTPVTVYYELAQPTVEHITYTGPISTRATDILAPSWTGKTTVTGTPSLDNPAVITGTPFRATATGPKGETHSVDLGFTGYSLPDGTKDTFDGVRGDFVQRIIKLSLNGTETWLFRGNNGNTITILVGAFDMKETNTISEVTCTHFPPDGDIDAATCFSWHDAIYLTIPLTILSAGTLDAAKSWLSAQAAAGTPVTVYYDLAEPIAQNRKTDIIAFDGQTTVTGADAVEIIEGRVLRVADCMPFEVTHSNPNLADNPYFTVNQQGKDEYTASNTAVMTFDRWNLLGYSSKTAKATKETDGVRLEHVNAFSQAIDALYVLPSLRGRVVTMSALVECVTAGIGNFGIVCDDKWLPGSVKLPTTAGTHLVSATMVIPQDAQAARLWVHTSDSGVYIIKPPIKLEVGPTQTLARKIGGQWIRTDPPPDPALELLKCQRHFWRQSGKWIPAGIGVAVAENMVHANISFPTPFRRTPEISFSKLYLNGTGALSTNAIPVTGYHFGRNGGSMGLIVVDCAGWLQVGATYVISSREENDAYLEFSAE